MNTSIKKFLEILLCFYLSNTQGTETEPFLILGIHKVNTETTYLTKHINNKRESFGLAII